MSGMEKAIAKIEQKAFKTWHTFPLGSRQVEVVILSVVEKEFGELGKTYAIISKKQLRELFDGLPEFKYVKYPDTPISIDVFQDQLKEWKQKAERKLGLK